MLVLGAYRVTRLIGWDELAPVAKLRSRATGARYDDSSGVDEEWKFDRPTLAHFLACPFCLGFWVSLAVYVAWLSAPTPTLYAMTPFAISGAVGLLAKNLDD